MAKISDKIIRKKVFDKYGGHCAYCGIKLNGRFTIDHIEPIRRKATREEIEKYGRGSNNIENFNPSCSSCNSSKSTFSIEDWRYEISQKYRRSLLSNSGLRLLIRFGILPFEINEPIKFYFEKYDKTQ